MVNFSRISCPHESHQKMPYEFVCLSPNCCKHGRQLCCLYCCEEYHPNHKEFIVTIKQILVELEQRQKKTDWNILSTLLQGIQTCGSFEQLKANFAQLLAYRKNPERYQKILDEEMQTLQSNTMRHYQRIHQRQTARTFNQKSIFISKSMITPVLTFKDSPTYTLNSPFSITNRKNQLITALAYPTLSKFHDSIAITVKIDRYTPAWLGVGLSIGESKYEDKSTKHVLAISNGWMSRYGALERSKVRFGGGDYVSVRWDKDMQLLEIVSGENKQTITFESRWNQEVYLCVCMFYRGDRVSILS